MLAWLSLDPWHITLLSFGYLFVLFIVAYWGQKQPYQDFLRKPWLYSLALGVSCTSWAFYGTVGQAATTGAWLAPVYIGSILCLTLAWPMLLKMLQLTKQQNLTSIADFIACRYNRSPKIAATVAIVALVGTVPYIALQLRAISKSFDLLTGTFQSGISTAFVVTLVLIFFSIVFGTRQLAVNKQNPGLVLAIAFSSIVKLLALTAVGIFVTFYLFDGFSDLYQQHVASNTSKTASSNIYLAVTQAVLGAITIFILPQQFHMMMIENHHVKELKTSRWLYPLYFILINLFVLPIAIAGQLTFPGGSVDADTFVLSIPLFYQQAWLGVVVYIGGLAAATGMVIVAAIVLSNMVSTELLTPLTLRYKWFNSGREQQLSQWLLNSRRITIALILLFAFAFERLIAEQNHLANIGLLSFALLAQFAPATVGALYWRRATANGAFIGLIVGSLVWLYTLLLPTLLPDAAWLTQGPWQLTWLQPQNLFASDWLDPVSNGVFYSLLANIICYVLVSLAGERSVGEKIQAELFLTKKQKQFERHLSRQDLANLLHRFINPQAAQALQQYAQTLDGQSSQKHQELVEYTRLQLSGVLGSASTRMVMKAATLSQESTQEVPLEDVVSIVDEANQIFKFNRDLLQAGVESIEQGISVVDADMRLVAWNKRYLELLDYPEGFVVAGKPIEELLRYNHQRGILVGDDIEDLIERRLRHMRQGTSHFSQRVMAGGIVLEIRGRAMPGGGFVSTFTDITAHIEAEKKLQKANDNLEKRVELRTNELMLAKAEAEAANRSKSRFLAAASHDLMQPFNALTLFTSMLAKKVEQQELSELVNHIQESLNGVEDLLTDLVEISRLDSGVQQLNISVFTIDEVLSPLAHEFTLLAQQQGIEFSYQPSHCFVKTDKAMLRRIMQNFLANAVRYCVGGKIVLGVRREQDGKLKLGVWDNGPGIAQEQQKIIFKEFERLAQTSDKPGLGLGLAIVERIAKLLNTQVKLNSNVGVGSVFSISLARYQSALAPAQTEQVKPITNKYEALNLTVMLIDNDPLLLKAMTEQLSEWGCQVYAVHNPAQLPEITKKPDLILSDYHLDQGANGVDSVQSLLTSYNWQIPCVIFSADPSEQVRSHTSNAQFDFIRKPIKSIALKRLLKKHIG